MTVHIQRLRRIVLVCLLAAAGLAATATNAFATHFRYGTITWQINDPTHPNIVTIRFDSAWRWSYPWSPTANPPLGTVVNPGNLVITGPGGYTSTIPLNITVTSINTVEDWFTGTFTQNVTLPAAGVNSAFYTATFNGGNRLSTIAEGNNDQSWNVQAGIIVPSTSTSATSIDQPPTSSTVPIIWPVDL